MYATNRMNPDRRDPAQDRMEYPADATAGSCRQHGLTARAAPLQQSPIGMIRPLDPPQTRGKTSNRMYRLAINPGGTACQPVHRNGASCLQGCAYSTLEADP
jgi:hypothetical protein